MKKFCFFLVFLVLGPFTKAQGFQIDSIAEVTSAVNEIFGSHLFTDGGVLNNFVPVGSNSPPSMGGAITKNGSVLAKTSDNTVQISTGNSWELIPGIADPIEIVPFYAGSAMIHAKNGDIFYGPSNGALPPSPFMNIGTNPIIDVWGQAFPLQGVQKVGSTDFIVLHGGASRDYVRGQITQGGFFSMSVKTTNYYHDGIIDSDQVTGGIDYLAVTTPVGTNDMRDRLIHISEDDSLFVWATVSAGVAKIATFDSAWTVLASSGPIHVTPEGGTTQYSGANLVLYNKTGQLQDIARIYYAEISDIEVVGNQIKVAINPVGASAEIHCGSNITICNGPSVVTFTSTIATSVAKPNPQQFFAVYSNESSLVVAAKERGMVQITNSIGQEVLKSTQVNGGEIITLSNLSSDTYLATFHGEDGTVATQKVVKN